MSLSLPMGAGLLPVAHQPDPFSGPLPDVKGEMMPHSPALGRAAAIPADPDSAVLDRVPNPHPDVDYLIRFTIPEFTALCPITGQPDFAHLVIDYVADQWMVESKALKLHVQLPQPAPSMRRRL